VLFGNFFFAVPDKRLFHPVSCPVNCLCDISFFVDNFQNFTGNMNGNFAVIIVVFASVGLFGKKPDFKIGDSCMVPYELLCFFVGVVFEFGVSLNMKTGYGNVHD